MKHKSWNDKKISIKWSIFGYLLIFTLLLLVILWVLQTMYLDTFYKSIKKKELQKAAGESMEAVKEESYQELLDEIAKDYDIRIVIGKSNGSQVYATGSNATAHISRMDTDVMIQLYEMAQENGGHIQISSKKGPQFKKMEQESLGERPTNIMQENEMKQMFDIPEDSGMETMIIAELVRIGKAECVMVADTMLTPVTATVQTLRIQLLYLSVILLVLALLLAFQIASHISKPIIQINRTAKKISQGNLHIEFEEKGYREISELSRTLNYTVEELTRSEKLQRELIANVSHDLRTPLTMITAYAEVMRDLPGENTPENVQVIIDEAFRLTELVNDLLDLSKLQAGVTGLQKKTYNLTAGMKAVLERYAKLTEQNQYQISFEYGDEEVWVEADEYKIYQVLYNLINNAIHYTGEDKKVTVRQIVSGSIVRIEVKDSGEGIPKEQLDHVWERYYKIDKNHKRAVMGTGLGLSIVKNILILHNAKYGVDSIPGVGSSFWFELKAADHFGVEKEV